MKKILLILAVLFCSTASLKANSNVEHDILYLRGITELETAYQQINNTVFSMNYTINSLSIYTIDRKHKKNYDLLDSHLLQYYSAQKLVMHYKEYYSVLENFIKELIATGVFTQDEITFFNTKLTSIKKSQDLAEKTLDLYKNTILAYEKRKR